MIKTIRGFMKRLNEDHVGAYAAQSAYFILLSFIPFVLLVVTLVKYTPLTRDDVYSVLINMLPTEFQSYVGGIVNEIFYQSVAYMPITIITTLWSAGKGIAALTNGLRVSKFIMMKFWMPPSMRLWKRLWFARKTRVKKNFPPNWTQNT